MSGICSEHVAYECGCPRCDALLRLFMFDLDGTLIRSHIGPDALPYDQVEILPNVKERLHDLVDTGKRIAVVTNQSGVAFGYQTEDQVKDKLRATLLALELDLATPLFVSFCHLEATVNRYKTDTHPFLRKPAPGMLLHAMLHCEALPAQSLMVGDLDTDRKAAALAGADFAWAPEFFA